jgi:hypothetical protein
VIFGVGGTDGEHQECQWAEFAEQETRDCMSSGVEDEAADLVAKSNYLFVGEMVGIGDVELDCEESGGLVGTDTGQVLRMECGYTATAQSTTWQESANHFEVVLGWVVEEVVLDSSLDR